MSRRRVVPLLAVLAACDHTAPFQAPPYAPQGPLGSGSPLRLTYNLGQDASPAWLPDGSAFVYGVERYDRADRDRCLALLPAGGGAITHELCDRLPAADDSTDAYAWGAPGPGGALAYTRATSFTPLHPIAPHDQQLVLGTLDERAPVRVLESIPYLAPSGKGHEGVAQIRWLTPTTLVYVGQHVAYVGACGSCPVDTIPTGLELVRLDLAAATPVMTIVPGTDQASSVAVAGDDTLYYTLNGDSRVFRRVLSSGAVAVVYDFGQIARDVQVAGGRLVAVVGGAVSFTTDPTLGPLQRDGGGALAVLDLASGLLVGTFDGAFRHPALDPSATRVVAELVTSGTTDLWEVTLP